MEDLINHDPISKYPIHDVTRIFTDNYDFKTREFTTMRKRIIEHNVNGEAIYVFENTEEISEFMKTRGFVTTNGNSYTR